MIFDIFFKDLKRKLFPRKHKFGIDDPKNKWPYTLYMDRKHYFCEYCGILCFVITFGEQDSELSCEEYEMKIKAEIEARKIMQQVLE